MVEQPYSKGIFYLWLHFMNSKHHPFTIERSSAKYFHGREEELNLFEGLLHETVYKRIGCSLLIQGPPGVGKSVLLDQCKQRAKKKQLAYCQPHK